MNNIDNIEALQKRIIFFLQDKDWDNAKLYCNKCLDIQPENPKLYFLLLLSELQISNKEQLINLHTDFGSHPTYLKVLNLSSDEDKIEFLNIYNENCYVRAKSILSVAKKRSQYIEASNILMKNPEYKDSKELLSYCEDGIVKAKKRKINNTKKIVISSIIFILIAIIGVLISFFVMNNQKEEMYTKISLLEKEKVKIDEDFSPIQKEINSKKIVLKNKKDEKWLIEFEIKNLNNEIRRHYKEIEDIPITYYAILDVIKKYEKEVDDYEKQLYAKNNEINSAQEDYDLFLTEHKDEIDYHKTKSNEIEKEINKANNKIDTINSIYKIFPYNFFMNILNN